jgi:hypothetical protein
MPRMVLATPLQGPRGASTTRARRLDTRLLASLVLAGLVGTAGPPSLQGQTQRGLEARAEWFARTWTEENAAALGSALLSQGIHLRLPGDEHVLIEPRQAEAAIRSFLQRYEGGEARVSQVSLTGGDPRKGFAEIQWQTRDLATSEAAVVTVFVGFGLEGETWRITEIRILSGTDTHAGLDGSNPRSPANSDRTP